MQSHDLQLQEAVFHQGHEQQSIIQRRITEWLILARIQFTIIREAWVWIFIMACMFPLTTLLFLKFFTVDPTPAVMTRIITGNMLFGNNRHGTQFHGSGDILAEASRPFHVLFVSADCQGKFHLCQFAARIDHERTLFYYPGHDWSTCLRHSIPLQLGTCPVLLLTVFSVVGAGVLIGFWSPSHQLTNMLVRR